MLRSCSMWVFRSRCPRRGPGLLVEAARVQTRRKRSSLGHLRTTLHTSCPGCRKSPQQGSAPSYRLYKDEVRSKGSTAAESRDKQQMRSQLVGGCDGLSDGQLAGLNKWSHASHTRRAAWAPGAAQQSTPPSCASRWSLWLATFDKTSRKRLNSSSTDPAAWNPPSPVRQSSRDLNVPALWNRRRSSSDRGGIHAPWGCGQNFRQNSWYWAYLL